MTSLFCFSYAGGVASDIYSSWQQHLGASVSVVPMDYPGRGNRYADPPATSPLELVRDLAQQVRQNLPSNGRWCVFGHSLGAMVAFEVARLLSSDPSIASPLLVFVSGRRPPGDSAATAAPSLEDSALIETAAAWGGIPPEFLTMPHLQPLIAAKLRIDLALGSHPKLDLPPLRCPVRVLSGTRDPLVDVFQLPRWSETTLEHTGIHLFDGDHFYFRRNVSRVIGVIREAVIAEHAHGTSDYDAQPLAL